MELVHCKIAFLVVVLALLLNYLILRLQSPSSSKDLYQILGVSPTADTIEISAAYNHLYQPLLTSMKTEPTFNTKEKLFDIRHAYDILSDKRRRRYYDTFQVDVLQGSVQRANERMIKTGNLEFESDHSVYWDVQPQIMSYPRHYSQFHFETLSLTTQNFDKLVLEGDDVWVILLYSEISIDSHDLTKSWSVVAEVLTGVAKVGHVEIGDLPLSVLLAEKTFFTKQPRFMSGLPEVVVFTSKCSRFDCVTRYRGLKTAHALTDWIATSLLKLPQIYFPRSKTLMKDFLIHGADPHKVKVLVFSDDGKSRPPLYIRQTAKKYQEHAVFAMVVWKGHEAAFQEFLKDPDLEMPRLVFVKDPGLKPVIYHGALNSSELERLMEEHKSFVLPQLRSISAEALGCDARGNSLAGNDTTTWYCVLLAGRTGRLLSEMRGVMRGVLQNLTKDTELVSDITDVPQHLLAAETLRSRRLSLSWLDGEKQKDFCYFYLHSPTMFEACGPRRYGEVDDFPKIFLIRYHRKLLTFEDHERLEKNKALRANNIWASLLSDDNENVASQLVSKYNGSADIGDVVQWISQMVNEGHNDELPGFGGRMPELVPEEKVSLWTETKKIVVDGQAKAVQNSQWFTRAFSWASTMNMNLVPVLFFLVIFFASRLFLRRKKLHFVGQDVSAVGVEQSSGGVSEEIITLSPPHVSMSRLAYGWQQQWSTCHPSTKSGSSTRLCLTLGKKNRNPYERLLNLSARAWDNWSSGRSMLNLILSFCKLEDRMGSLIGTSGTARERFSYSATVSKVVVILLTELVSYARVQAQQWLAFSLLSTLVLQGHIHRDATAPLASLSESAHHSAPRPTRSDKKKGGDKNEKCTLRLVLSHLHIFGAMPR